MATNDITEFGTGYNDRTDNVLIPGNTVQNTNPIVQSPTSGIASSKIGKTLDNQNKSMIQSFGGNPNISLVDFLDQQGISSDANNRTRIAKAYGINDYFVGGGNASMNTQLLNAIKADPSRLKSLNNTMTGTEPGPATDTTATPSTPSTATSTTGTQQSTSQTNQTLATYDPYKDPIAAPTFQKIDQYTSELSKALTNEDSALNTELGFIMSQFGMLKNEQIMANQTYESGIRQAGITGGISDFAPNIADGLLKQVADDGIKKISSIVVNTAKLVNEAKNSSSTRRRQIVGELKNLETEKLNIARQMKQDFIDYRNQELEYENNVVATELPGIYANAVMISDPAQREAYLLKESSRLGILPQKFKNLYASYSQQTQKDTFAQMAELNEKYKLGLSQAQMMTMLPEQFAKMLQSNPEFAKNQALARLGAVAGNTYVDPTDTNALTNFANAISGQESGGNYKAVNKDSGALGKYQIMPFHLPKIGLADTPANRQKFLNSPELQESLRVAMMRDIAQRNGGDARKMAAEWYGGAGGVKKLDTSAGDVRQGKNGEYPSINEYVDQVMGKLGATSGAKQSQDVIKTAVNNLLSTGKFTGPKQTAIKNINNSNTLWEATVSALDTETKKDARAAWAMTDIVKMLADIKSKIPDGNIGWLGEKEQSIRQAFGDTKSKEIAKLASAYKDLLMKNRNDITGAAWGTQEDKEYATRLPRLRDGKDLYEGKISALIDSAYTSAKSSVGASLGGGDIFDSLYRDKFYSPQKQSTTSNTKLNSLRAKYNY